MSRLPYYRHDDLVGWRYYWEIVVVLAMACWDTLLRRPLK